MQHWVTVGPQNLRLYNVIYRSKVDELQREVRDLADLTAQNHGHMTAVAPANLSSHHTVAGAVCAQHDCTVLKISSPDDSNFLVALVVPKN